MNAVTLEAIAPNPTLAALFAELLPEVEAAYPWMSPVQQKAWARTEARRRTGIYPEPVPMVADKELRDALETELEARGLRNRSIQAVYVGSEYDPFTGALTHGASWTIEVRLRPAWRTREEFERYYAGKVDAEWGWTALDVAKWFAGCVEEMRGQPMHWMRGETGPARTCCVSNELRRWQRQQTGRLEP